MCLHLGHKLSKNKKSSSLKQTFNVYNVQFNYKKKKRETSFRAAIADNVLHKLVVSKLFGHVFFGLAIGG